MSQQQNTFSRYPGIRSFQTSESSLFFGRSRETREFYSLMKVERFMVLFSKSGMGKTSLLNAGVLPLLEKDEYSAVPMRFQSTDIAPEEMLYKAMQVKIQALGLEKMVDKRLQKWAGDRKTTLWEYLKACSIVMNYLPARPLLVLDQFEEFFMHSTEAQQPFIQLLADMIFGRVPRMVREELDKKGDSAPRYEEWGQPLNIKLILAIRSDRLSMLENLSSQIPAILNNRYQLQALNRRQASEAILLPAQSTTHDFSSPVFEYSDAALKEMLDNLSNKKGEIESFQLQIVCGSLEEKVVKENLKEITPAHIGGAAGIQKILNNYYENRITGLGAESDQLLARKLVEEGLIVDGVRVSLAERIIHKSYEISPELLTKIERTRIIKPEDTPLGKAYEVSHDTLVKPILNSYNKRRIEEEKLAAEQERIRLEKAAEEQRKKAELEASRRRKANIIAVVAIVMAVISVVTGFMAYTAQKEAVVAKKKAEDAQIAAEEKEIAARDNLNLFLLAEIKTYLQEANDFKGLGDIGRPMWKSKMEEVNKTFDKLYAPTENLSEEKYNKLSDDIKVIAEWN